MLCCRIGCSVRVYGKSEGEGVRVHKEGDEKASGISWSLLAFTSFNMSIFLWVSLISVEGKRESCGQSLWTTSETGKRKNARSLDFLDLDVFLPSTWATSIGLCMLCR